MMIDYVRSVVEAVSSWQGIAAQPHRFGGTEFVMGKVEIGHIHRNGMVDIPFTRKIRDQLLEEDHAERHHLLTDSGWISFYIRTEADVERAIWLYKLSYLHKTSRRRESQGDVVAEMSAPLRALVLGDRASTP